MLSSPTPAKESSWSAVATSAAGASGAPPAHRPERAPVREPPHAPEVCGAVDTMWTRESGSSTHSTGISVTRRPRRSAVTSELGVEEPGLVLDQREELECPLAAQRLEAALEVAHLAAQRRAHEQAVAPARSARAWVRAPPGRPGPAGCRRRRRRVPRAPRRGAASARERGRQVDVHVGDDLGPAGLPGRRSAWPRPLRVRIMACTPSRVDARRWATSAVPSVLPLSTMVTSAGRARTRSGRRAASRCARPTGAPRCTRARRSRPGPRPDAGDR